MEFLFNTPALIHKDALIIADTHFGIEKKLAGKGIADSDFSVRLALQIESLLKAHKNRVKKIILLGDVKEEIFSLDAPTRRILDRLAGDTEILITKGNHDGGIESFSNAKVFGSGGFVYEGLGLFHGHAWPNPELMMCDFILCGHEHPAIKFIDSFGGSHLEPVWTISVPQKIKIKKFYKNFNENIRLILVPSFNPLQGLPLNERRKSGFGIMFDNKLFKATDTLVFRLDGTPVGRLKDLKS